ncbi:hypothetical protein [Agrobacterium tumefaciens]|uniref:hypothetical protein n=1 Tax=Agrobacterium tumefaciens TaxID=358 RepID=UPI0015863605|nr:hypothetical protein [Agrobacterium tumefaciens]
MSNDADKLPLFAWKQPECRLIPFPMVNRIDEIAKRLRCKRCSVKGDVKITIAKMPR